MSLPNCLQIIVSNVIYIQTVTVRIFGIYFLFFLLFFCFFFCFFLGL